MITEDYKTMNSENTVLVKGGGEDVTNNDCGWVVPFKPYAASKMELFVIKIVNEWKLLLNDVI